VNRISAAALLAALAVSLAMGQDDAKGGLVDRFTTIENDWWQADKAKDEGALGRILADDWFYLGPAGTMTKAEELADLKKRNENIASLTLTDMKVRVYGEVAIVTFREHEKSTKNGTDSSGDYLYTDVFVQRQGRWQAVNSQGTPVARK